MTLPALRCLPLLLLPLLAACQSQPQTPSAAVRPAAVAQLEAQVAAGELDAATATFRQLQQGHDAAALERSQRLLADAWLQRSQQALEAGDLNAATAALANARALLPQAPALTNGLGGALQRPSER
ncbi:MAG: hypothetical protein KBF00_02765 [Pseudomonas sp.]|nr:hypothetical protein [Pseudomonas sp.]